MKCLIKKLILFLVPCFIVCLIILVIDPYDYFGVSPFAGDEDKIRIAKVEDSSRRQRIINYRKHPTKNIIIGASQIGHIDAQNIGGGNWSNIANGGANIDDEVIVFWQIVNDYPIDSVLFSVEPYNYTVSDGHSSHQMMTDAYKMITNPLLYFVDRYVYKTTASYIIHQSKKLISKKNEEITEAPNSTKDAFWNSQIELAKSNLKNRRNSNLLRENIQEIVKYCRDNNIYIAAVVPMSHVDLYNVFSEYKEAIFLLEVTSDFGIVYDFMIPNSFTQNKENFGDPLHAHGESDIYIDAIFKKGSNNEYFKLYKNE